MRNNYILLLAIAIIAVSLSSCSADYDQVVIAQAVKEPQHTATTTSTTTTTTTTKPTTTSIPTTTSMPTTISTTLISTTTMPTTTSTTTTSTTLSPKAQEALLEKKQGYLIDLTTLNINNCDDSIAYLERERKTTQDKISKNSEDLDTELTNIISLKEAYERYRSQGNAAMIDYQIRKIDVSQDKIDSLKNENDDAALYLEEIKGSLEKVKDECKRIEVLASLG
jgi:hypothetical protein